MTTIIGVQYEDRALLMADSQVTDDNGRIYNHPDQIKITERNGLLIAGAGEVGPCDIANHLWTPPKLTSKDFADIYHFAIILQMLMLSRNLI
jgi:hypothetical protein